MKSFTKTTLTLCVAVLFALNAAAQGTTARSGAGTVWGSVTDSRTGETLIGCTIYDTLSHRGTVTDAHGRFTLTPGTSSVVLRVSYVGYETQYFALDLTHSQRLEVRLTEGTTLTEVRIVGQRNANVENSQTSRVEIPVELVRNVPVMFGETDVIKVVQLLPGVQSGGEGTTGMYVRGGGPDENLYLLDGVPMYNVNHLGGFFSAFNSDAVKGISLYKGSFPARFGSRLSSVLDITTNNGNDKEYHGGIDVGLIAAKASIEGPIVKERTTFSLSARRTYYDLLLQPLLAAMAGTEEVRKLSAGYYFYDLNAKVTHKFNNKSRLYASFYMGDDAVYLDMNTGYSYTANTSMKMNYYWGNIVGSLRWNRELSPRLFMNLTAAYTRYRNDITMNETMEMPQTVYSQYLKEEMTMGFKSGIQDVMARADFDYAPHPDHAVKFGGQYVFHLFTPETSSLYAKEESLYDNYVFDTLIGQSVVGAHEMTAFVEDDWKVGDHWKVNAGLNLTGFGVQDTFYPSIQPRISGRWLISDDLSAKVGYAYMTQYMHLLSNNSISLPTDLWVPVTARIAPMNAHQVAAGLYYRLRDIVDLSVEGYYKHMDNLLEYRDGASFWGSSQGWESKVCSGRGWSYGVELLAQKNVGRLTGWVGYTWSHTDRLFDREGETLNGGNPFPARYDRRHDVSIVLTYKFSETFDAGITWVFSSGNAVTLGTQEFDPTPDASQEEDYYHYWDEGNVVTYVESRNNYRMPNYHRMDVSLNWHKQLKHGRRTLNVSIYNVYNRKNPYMIYESWTDGYGTLKQLSIFPLIPSVSWKWKF